MPGVGSYRRHIENRIRAAPARWGAGPTRPPAAVGHRYFRPHVRRTQNGLMTIYAVTYRYSDDVATRDRVRPEHREYLRGLADRGLLLLSGPFGPDEPAGALLIFRAEDKAEVAALIEKDPFSVSGVITSSETVEWSPVLGPLLSGIS